MNKLKDGRANVRVGPPPPPGLCILGVDRMNSYLSAQIIAGPHHHQRKQQQLIGGA